ncbi:MAG: aminoacyl-tRNA hydrolase, partial [Bacteroidota bacterium]
KCFTEESKVKLRAFFKNRINAKGVLTLSSGQSRSQHRNKEAVIRRLFNLIDHALGERKERIPTKTPKAVIRKRLESKRRQSQKKANRKKPNID